MRVVACEAWGRHGTDAQALKLLSDALRSDVDADVRLTAAKAFGETKNPQAVAALGEALNDPRDPPCSIAPCCRFSRLPARTWVATSRAWQQYVKATPATPAPVADGASAQPVLNDVVFPGTGSSAAKSMNALPLPQDVKSRSIGLVPLAPCPLHICDCPSGQPPWRLAGAVKRAAKAANACSRYVYRPIQEPPRRGPANDRIGRGRGHSFAAGRAYRVVASEGPARQGKVVVAANTSEDLAGAKEVGLPTVRLDMPDSPIYERLTQSVLEAVADDLLTPGCSVIALYSGFDADTIDSLSVINLDEHLNRLTGRDLRQLETRVPLDTLKIVVDLAVEIGRDGREGKPVGTLFVVGDSRKVMACSRPTGFDPLRGYSRKERNLDDPAFAKASRRSRRWTARSSSRPTAWSRLPAATWTARRPT